VNVGASKSQTGADAPEPPLDKETVRLPDGRELTYYRFPEVPPPAAAAPAPAPGGKKER
jgi:hypothetical protein